MPCFKLISFVRELEYIGINKLLTLLKYCIAVISLMQGPTCFDIYVFMNENELGGRLFTRTNRRPYNAGSLIFSTLSSFQNNLQYSLVDYTHLL